MLIDVFLILWFNHLIWYNFKVCLIKKIKFKIFLWEHWNMKQLDDEVFGQKGQTNCKISH